MTQNLFRAGLNTNIQQAQRNHWRTVLIWQEGLILVWNSAAPSSKLFAKFAFDSCKLMCVCINEPVTLFPLNVLPGQNCWWQPAWANLNKSALALVCWYSGALLCVVWQGLIKTIVINNAIWNFIWIMLSEMFSMYCSAGTPRERHVAVLWLQASVALLQVWCYAVPKFAFWWRSV